MNCSGGVTRNHTHMQPTLRWSLHDAIATSTVAKASIRMTIVVYQSNSQIELNSLIDLDNVTILTCNTEYFLLYCQKSVLRLCSKNNEQNNFANFLFHHSFEKTHFLCNNI